MCTSKIVSEDITTSSLYGLSETLNLLFAFECREESFCVPSIRPIQSFSRIIPHDIKDMSVQSDSLFKCVFVQHLYVILSHCDLLDVLVWSK